MYDIRLLPPAGRFIKKIKDKCLKALILDVLDNIKGDPYTGEAKTGDLQGIFGYDIYYKKVNYEIAYSIVELPEKLVIVILAGTRENFYEQLKRYLYQ
jgi:Txe/YoeB family toxin of Txe-Axe toxin-antitoxin module